MNSRRGWGFAAIASLTLAASHPARSDTPTRPVVPKSGNEYASADIRAFQADDAANPGMLWVTRGEVLWNEIAGKAEKSCAQCHGAASVSMRGAATRYPQIDTPTRSRSSARRH
jgi:L-cysteine S-thiosulfotransferase